MSETIMAQDLQQIAQPGLYNRLLSTEEAAAATGLSQYELRRGARSGRYPVIMTGDESCKFRKMKWDLVALREALRG